MTTRLALVAIAAFGCQVLLFPMTGIAAVTPEFVLATVVVAALVVAPIPAIVFAVACGLLQDAFAGGVIGLHGFAFPPSAYLVSRFRTAVRANSRLAVFLVCAGAAPIEVGLLLALEQVTGAGPTSAQQIASVFLGLPLTAGYGLAVYRFVVPRGPARLPLRA